ncbi:MAG: hypothetical protein LQ350_004698 [Teloschistes chrysophthalmus]|nr:MAG: hypothetical protein LQ350_004698 [Niorma chrysophthalma]
MADPLSVIGVLIAIAQITPAVVNYVKDFKHASSEGRQLLLEVRSTSGIVLLLRDLASETSPTDPWSASLENLSELLEQYERMLKDIAHTLESTSRKRDALKWPFEKKTLAETLANMERYKTAFLLALQNVQNEVSYSIKCSIEDTHADVRGLRESQLAKEAEETLQWVSSLDFKLIQNDTLRRRHPDTGTWILKEPSFIAWVNGESNTLCCEGIPGAGKTIMAAIVVDHLKRQPDLGFNTKGLTKSSIGLPHSSVTCIYCTYKERNTQTAENLVGSLAKQLAEYYPKTLFPMVSELYQARTIAHERLSLADCVSLLGSMLQCFRQNYIVVDALDECAADVKDDLMNSLESLQQVCGLKVIVTLRPDTTIASLDPAATKFLEIRAQDADIRKYLTARIASERRSFTAIRGKPDMVALAIDTILERSQGMFLLARLHLNSVAVSPSIAILKTTLRTLPQQLNATYDEAMLRLEDQHDELTKLAKKVLAGLLYTTRSLTVRELQHALAADSTTGTQGVDEEHIVSVEDMVYSCTGLVTWDHETKVIRMVHYSAQEYLTANRLRYFPNGHYDIALVCLKYLVSDLFAKVRCSTSSEMILLKEEHPFLDYAARNWGHHVRESGRVADLLPRILDFMSMTSNLTVATQVACQDFIYHPWIFTRFHLRPNSPILPPLQVAAYFGLVDAGVVLIEKGADVDECAPVGALGIASQRGFDDFVRLLLDRKADVHEAQHHGITPLHRAASQNHPKVVELLLQHNKSIFDARNIYGKTALHDAAERGFADVVRVLLEYGANPTPRSNSSDTPLSGAANFGDIPTARLLLEAGVPIDSSEPGIVQASYAAASSSHHAMLAYLFGKGAAVDARGCHNNTVLHGAACGGGDPAIVRLIMKQPNAHTMVNSVNLLLKSALHDAVERNRLAFVAALLEYNPEQEPDIEGRCPLHWAVFRDYVPMTKLLLEKENGRASINKRAGQRYKNMTALEMAVDMQHIEIIKMISEAL